MLEGHAGTLQERVDVEPVVGEEGHAQARGDQEIVSADGEGAAQGETELVRDNRHVLVALEPRQENREDVAAEAGDGVPLPQSALQGDGNALEKVVSEAATQSVVDGPEAVEPQLDHREAALVALGVDDRHREAVAKPTGARDPGERVVVAEGAHLLLDPVAGFRLLLQLGLEALDLVAQDPDLLLQPLLSGRFLWGGGRFIVRRHLLVGFRLFPSWRFLVDRRLVVARPGCRGLGAPVLGLSLVFDLDTLTGLGVVVGLASRGLGGRFLGGGRPRDRLGFGAFGRTLPSSAAADSGHEGAPSVFPAGHCRSGLKLARRAARGQGRAAGDEDDLMASAAPPPRGVPGARDRGSPRIEPGPIR
jgi:hypothetical protein